jgi:periplasmic divalent cation tolerance protein
LIDYYAKIRNNQMGKANSKSGNQKQTLWCASPNVGIQKVLVFKRSIMREYIQIETTFDTKKEAVQLAGLILDAKLVADGQIGEINSVFNFENKRYDRKEFLLTMHTREELYCECEKFIKSKHSFKVPQIIATQLISGLKEYLDWIDDNTKV